MAFSCPKTNEEKVAWNTRPIRLPRITEERLGRRNLLEMRKTFETFIDQFFNEILQLSNLITLYHRVNKWWHRFKGNTCVRVTQAAERKYDNLPLTFRITLWVTSVTSLRLRHHHPHKKALPTNTSLHICRRSYAIRYSCTYN